MKSTKSIMGRPKKDPKRSKLIRYGAIHDKFTDAIEQFENESDKKKILDILEELSTPPGTKCS